MNIKKPSPIVADDNDGKLCPVCGTRSYSAGGIHPQCAVQQADAPREQKLKADKKAAAKNKTVGETSPPTWNRKKCPKCGVQVHARKKLCGCGFDFFKS